MIHRDVKPKNIILTPQSVAKLTDLGLARAQDDKEAAESEAGKAYGTPYYISPEQIRGDVDIDFRAPTSTRSARRCTTSSPAARRSRPRRPAP